jgi:hypothetical protein
MAAAAAPSWNRRSTVEQCDPNRGGEMARAYEATSLSVSKSWSTPKVRTFVDFMAAQFRAARG